MKQQRHLVALPPANRLSVSVLVSFQLCAVPAIFLCSFVLPMQCVCVCVWFVFDSLFVVTSYLIAASFSLMSFFFWL